MEERMVEVGLQLHPDKTRIVYCKDANRRGSYEHTEFTFLGYTFRTALRGCARTAGCFGRFSRRSAGTALKRIGAEVRSWRLHRRTRA